jgi:RNA polymerase sigma factor (sigma-70 family)
MGAIQKLMVTKQLQTVFSSGVLGDLSDAELLDRFVSQFEEVAFETIVHRHGPMVWGVCRRVLGEHHGAEDAFQATFLVLARKAASVMPREKLGNWLYGVANQTAMKAKATTYKWRAREKQVPDMPEQQSDQEDCPDDWLALLDQELSRLPERYRIPIILCELEGKTHKQAAQQLGWPIGTVSGRLSRGRSMLAGRLTRRGVKLASGSLAALLSQSSASAGVPLSLITSTTRAATKIAAGQAAAGLVSAKVAALTEGALKAMLMTKVKIGTAVLMMVALGTVGTTSFDFFGRRAEASSLAKQVEQSQFAAREVQARGDKNRQKSLDPKAEMKKLEGTWAITNLIEGGHQVNAEDQTNGIGRVVIKDGKMTMSYTMRGAEGNAYSLSIDPDKCPNGMSLIRLDEKSEEIQNQPVLLGIYELKNDALTICLGLDRPENFEAVSHPMRTKFILKWAKR